MRWFNIFLGMAFVIILFPSAFAQTATFSTDRDNFTEKLAPLAVYIERMELAPNYTGQMRFTFSSLDESRNWASFVYDGRRFTEITVPAKANQSFLMYFEIIIPEDFESTQHVLNINIEFMNATKTIPVYLKPAGSQTPLDQIFVGLSNFLNSNVVTFPENSMLGMRGVTGWALAILISAILIIIVLIKAAYWVRER